MLLATYRSNDRERLGVVGNLTYTDVWEMFVKQGGRCAQTMIPMYVGDNKAYNAFKLSVDRHDNSLPHTVDHVQLVIRAYNTSKAGRDDYNIPETVLRNLRYDYRVRPLDDYLFES